MRSKKEEKRYKFTLSCIGVNERAFRRWLVVEIESGRTSVNQAIQEFDFEHKSPSDAIRFFRKAYGSEIVLTLPSMTEQERKKLAEKQKYILQLEKQLETAQMQNLALNTLIDVAEEELSIKIRKKSGTKQ